MNLVRWLSKRHVFAFARRNTCVSRASQNVAAIDAERLENGVGRSVARCEWTPERLSDQRHVVGGGPERGMDLRKSQASPIPICPGQAVALAEHGKG
ncbi:hypothetical protein GCM10007863_05920 [Dyella mobilis]|nr:hypothetical protein GCM10007863_05920 [Dyella mobilis]